MKVGDERVKVKSERAQVRSPRGEGSARGWIHRYRGYDPAQEGLREALCTLGNGYFATRGAAEWSGADGVHYPGTYLAGGYDRARTRIAGREIENEDLVNLPNWLPLRFRVDGADVIDLASAEILSYVQELRMREGRLVRALRIRDAAGRVSRYRSERFVHMRHPHLAGIRATLRPENWSGRVTLLSGLDGRVENLGVERYGALESRHLAPLDEGALPEGIRLSCETLQSKLRIALAARTRVRLGAAAGPMGASFRQRASVDEDAGDPAAAPPEPPLERAEVRAEPGAVEEVFELDVGEGEEVVVEKIVALHTSRDRAISEPAIAAREAVTCAEGFLALCSTHEEAWAHLWRRSDLVLAGRARTQCILRLHVFHLLQTASLHTPGLDVGVPARGWHGEAYRGHIFWDELFILPWLNLRFPQITRALLEYRHRRLPAARRAAKREGFDGALYPWQSGSDGREETQQIHLNPRSGRWLPDDTHLQRHVNAAIAYNVWLYFQATGDLQFLGLHGAEMILEIARFWASAATWNDELERWEILGVIGPDEYHDAYPDAERPGIDNNSYTNLMAVWVLRCALEMLELLGELRRREICELIDLEEPELERWDRISRGMRLVFHEDGILTQFEGYEALEELDWEAYRRRYDDIQRLDRILEAEGDTPNRYKVSKQADVLMLFYLLTADEIGELFRRLGYAFDPADIPRTIDYYLRRSSDGSTLSRVVHSWILARSDRERSWDIFRRALASDVEDIQGGTTAEGIHLGAMAGTVDLVQRAYCGLTMRREALGLDPVLPEELRGLDMLLHYRDVDLDVRITDGALTIRALDGPAPPVRLEVAGESFTLAPGSERSFRL